MSERVQAPPAKARGWLTRLLCRLRLGGDTEAQPAPGPDQPPGRVEPGLLGEAALDWAVGCSRIGASHRREGKPCQDVYNLSVGCVAGAPAVAAAVADGHGDPRHDLSHTGAALAVRCAVEELVGLHAHHAAEGHSALLNKSFKEDFPRRLGRRWREAVLADSGDTGRPEAELLTRYGTTLLVALAVGEVVLIGQLGDGDVLLVRGQEVERPVAGAAGTGGATESLCSPEAHLLWRTATLGRGDGGLLLLATDGLTNAFAEEGEWLTFARSLRDRLYEHGPEKVAASLPGWLDHYSEQATGDDITLALVALRPAGPHSPGEKEDVGPGAGEGQAGKAPGSPAPA